MPLAIPAESATRTSGVGSAEKRKNRLTMKRLGYVPALDGIRGIAIALVVSTHYFNFPAGGAGAGVGLFFVLSGYLITTLLLEEHAETGRSTGGACSTPGAQCRLFPALAVLLVVYVAVAALQEGLMRRCAPSRPAVYTANIAQAYWPHLMNGEPIGPLWSLAEEEQFYFLWPVLLILALALKFRKALVPLLGLAILAIWFERFYLYYAVHVPWGQLYTSPEAAADRILTGVLLALLLYRGFRINPVLAGFGIELFLFLVFVGIAGTIGGPIIDVAGFAIVGLVVQSQGAARALSWRPLVWLGLISYSLYLWHVVVLSWFGFQPGGVYAYHDRGAALVASLGIAWLSYRFVETRFRRRRVPRSDTGSQEKALSLATGDAVA